MGSMLGKKIWGRKRHILVDTQGFLLAAIVHSAGVVDCHGARLLLEPLVGRFPRLTISLPIMDIVECSLNGSKIS